MRITGLNLNSNSVFSKGNIRRPLKQSEWAMTKPAADIILQVVSFIVVVAIIIGVVVLGYGLYQDLCLRYPEMCGKTTGFSDDSATVAAEAIHCALTWTVTGDMNTPCGADVVVGGGVVDALKENNDFAENNEDESGLSGILGGFLLSPTAVNDEEITGKEEKIDLQLEEYWYVIKPMTLDGSSGPNEREKASIYFETDGNLYDEVNFDDVFCELKRGDLVRVLDTVDTISNYHIISLSDIQYTDGVSNNCINSQIERGFTLALLPVIDAEPMHITTLPDPFYIDDNNCERIMPHFIYDDKDNFVSGATKDIYYYFDAKNKEWIWRCPGCNNDFFEGATKYERFGDEDPKKSYFKFDLDTPTDGVHYATIADLLWSYKNDYKEGIKKLFSVLALDASSNHEIRIEYSNGISETYRHETLGDINVIADELMNEVPNYPKRCERFFGVQGESLSTETTNVNCLFSGKTSISGKDFSKIYGTPNSIITQNSFFILPENFDTCIIKNIYLPQTIEEVNKWQDKFIAKYGDPEYIIYWQEFPADQDTWTYKPNWKLAAGLALLTAIPIGKVVGTVANGVANLGVKYAAEKAALKGLSLTRSQIIGMALKNAAGKFLRDNLINAFKTRALNIGINGVKLVLSKRTVAGALVGLTVGGATWAASIVDSYNAKYNQHANSIVLKEPFNKEVVYKLPDEMKGTPVIIYWDPDTFSFERRKPFHLVSPCKIDTLEINKIVPGTEENECVICQLYTYVYKDVNFFGINNKWESIIEEGASTCENSKIFTEGSAGTDACPSDVPSCSINEIFESINFGGIKINAPSSNRNGQQLTISDLFNLKREDLLTTFDIDPDNSEGERINNGIYTKEFSIEIPGREDPMKVNIQNVDFEDEMNAGRIYSDIGEDPLDSSFETITFIFHEVGGVFIRDIDYKLILTDVDEDGTFDTYSVDPKCASETIVITPKLETVERGEYNYCVNPLGARQAGLKWTGVAVGTLGVLAVGILTGGAGWIAMASIYATMATGAGISAYAEYADWTAYWPGPPAGDFGGPPLTDDEVTSKI
ncbi:MAG: hypothetical protein ABIF08_02795 [Nanoarchaeota archaeon]